jgi:hypothetical protein
MRHAQRALFTLIVLLCPATEQAAAQEGLERLSDPVRTYAEGLEPYCKALGKRGVTVNEMYRDDPYGVPDVNRDGVHDYFAYKCMFGCANAPFALMSIGHPCPFGVLLLSSEQGYRTIPLPGTITQLDPGPPLRIVVTRQRINKEDCRDPFGCSYIFALREGRFQLVEPCPADGCRTLLSRVE